MTAEERTRRKNLKKQAAVRIAEDRKFKAVLDELDGTTAK
jgi:hypothetical protein